MELATGWYDYQNGVATLRHNLPKSVDDCVTFRPLASGLYVLRSGAVMRVVSGAPTLVRAVEFPFTSRAAEIREEVEERVGQWVNFADWIQAAPASGNAPAEWRCGIQTTRGANRPTHRFTLHIRVGAIAMHQTFVMRLTDHALYTRQDWETQEGPFWTAPHEGFNQPVRTVTYDGDAGYEKLSGQLLIEAIP